MKVKALLITALIIAVGYIAIDAIGFKNVSLSSVDEPFISQEERDKKAIIESIEIAFLNFSNGMYYRQNVPQEEFPFYNINILQVATQMGMLMTVQMFSAFSEKNTGSNINITPSNYKITFINDNEANVDYNVTGTVFGEAIDDKAKITAKRISGRWLLDGKQFFGSK